MTTGAVGGACAACSGKGPGRVPCEGHVLRAVGSMLAATQIGHGQKHLGKVHDFNFPWIFGSCVCSETFSVAKYFVTLIFFCLAPNGVMAHWLRICD